ncbi:hypothetical protein [Methanobacterium aggregans]|uniref:hypothetical protein n=1 Tax=Methanobacterium aggregans TaxID=1615586 RepID=UPI001AE42778|nr:hypothetical protein [Methanobacterium aggregans]MBP2045186.1 hypothetical protein [Methanobacterium aggregans]
MYFKMKTTIHKFNFPKIADIVLDKDKEEILPPDTHFVSNYCIVFFYKDFIVLLPITGVKITQSYITSFIDVPSDIESILCSIIPSYPLMDVRHAEEDFWIFSMYIHEKLSSYIIRTIDMLRWRFALKGEHNYLKSFKDYNFSLDGKIWFKMPPSKKSLTIRPELISNMDYRRINEAQNLMQIYDREPLEHEMYREAYSNLNTNPRSSLIMAVSSAEVGFKRLANELHPQNEWLLENIQSPPLRKMLKDYLPLLPTKLKINGKVLVPPHIVRAINKAVEERNKLVHTGISKIDKDELLEILDVVNDLLYLFDYYRGFEWALGHLSLETQKALNLVEIKK